MHHEQLIFSQRREAAIRYYLHHFKACLLCFFGSDHTIQINVEHFGTSYMNCSSSLKSHLFFSVQSCKCEPCPSGNIATKSCDKHGYLKDLDIQRTTAPHSTSEICNFDVFFCIFFWLKLQNFWRFAKLRTTKSCKTQSNQRHNPCSASVLEVNDVQALALQKSCLFTHRDQVLIEGQLVAHYTLKSMSSTSRIHKEVHFESPVLIFIV